MSSASGDGEDGDRRSSRSTRRESRVQISGQRGSMRERGDAEAPRRVGPRREVRPDGTVTKYDCGGRPSAEGMHPCKLFFQGDTVTAVATGPICRTS